MIDLPSTGDEWAAVIKELNTFAVYLVCHRLWPIRKLAQSMQQTLGSNFQTPSQAIFTHSEPDSGRSECLKLIFKSALSVWV
jgi:hypothetical protein